MDLHSFLCAHRAEWPLGIGKMQTISQTHLVSAAGMPTISHPLLSDGFLKKADVILVTIHGPKPLQNNAVTQFMRQIDRVAAKNAIRDYEVKPGTLTGAISVSIILAGRLHE